MKRLLTGKKSVLFALTPVDITKFVKSFESEDGFSRIGVFDWDILNAPISEWIGRFVAGQPLFWLAKTNQGKGARDIGYFWLNKNGNHWGDLEGLVANSFINNLADEIKHQKYTYLEDAVKTFLNHMFSECDELKRVGCIVFPNNSDVTALLKKIEFKEEGKLRNMIKYDSRNFSDIISFSLLKEEVK